MQIWIYFIPGAGGDGFANLLEHATNVTPLDQDLSWRVHRYVNNSPKFWAPVIDQLHCFRKNEVFKNSNNSLDDNYVDLVKRNETVICTTHDVHQQYLPLSDDLDIIYKDHIKILIDCDELEALKSALIKNLMPYNINKTIKMPNHSNFDYVIHTNQINDWNSVSNLCQQLNLNLDYQVYQEFKSIVNGTKVVDNFGIDHYSAVFENNQVTYQKL